MSDFGVDCGAGRNVAALSYLQGHTHALERLKVSHPSRSSKVISGQLGVFKQVQLPVLDFSTSTSVQFCTLTVTIRQDLKHQSIGTVFVKC